VAANALDVSPRRHTVAIFIGLFCVLADYIQVEFGLTTAFGAEVVTRGVFSAGTAGGIMNALVLTAIVCDLIDREFLRAAVFCFIACWFSMFGLMHSNNLQGHSIGADHRAGRGELTSRAPWKSTSELGCLEFSRQSSRRSYGENIASMAWGARNLIST